jgi:uncharacterized protein (TIGR00251 family)
MIKNRPELDGVLEDNSDGLICSVIVLPRSSRCALAGIHDGALKVKLTKPPVAGEANAECCRFMAKLLGIPKTHIVVARGVASRRKALRISGLSAADARERLAGALSESKSPVT